VPVQNSIAKASNGANEARVYRRLDLIALSTKTSCDEHVAHSKVGAPALPNGCGAATSWAGSAACEKWPDFLDFRWMQNVHSGGKFAVQDRPGEILREKCGVKKL
jgi:hypothetical protein